MGLRFRKSINLGGGFKINISKSGIGYSWGIKGARITKKAKGGLRYTASIPRTGISYSQDINGRVGHSKAQQNNRNNPSENSSNIKDNNYYDTQEISNGNINDMHSEGLEELIDSANKSLKFNNYSTIGILGSLIFSFINPLFCIGVLVFWGWKIYIKKNGVINLEYNIDEDQKILIKERMTLLQQIASSKKIWRITQTSKVIDKKYASGANSSIKRTPCLSLSKLPFPFSSNEISVCFRSGKETLIFLPDKFFVIQSGSVGALSYSDLSSTVKGSQFIEDGPVPSDAKIVDRTWKYVNKNGGPDKRFSDNREIPVCLYGELILSSKVGNINTVLMFSNTEINNN